MDRRSFFTRLAGAPLLGAAPAIPAPAPLVEPPSPNHAFTDFNYGVYVQPSAYGVSHVLAELGWDPQSPLKPLLVTSVRDYPVGLEITKLFEGAIGWLASNTLPEDQWYVAWNGRAIGSRSGDA